MPGYLEDGYTKRNFNPNNAQVYCDGVQARVDASGTDTPNPYTEAVEKEFFDAWAAGYAYADGFEGSSITTANNQSCAVTGAVAVIP